METRGSLPEYRVRESARARRVCFRMTASEGLIVVVPRGFDRGRIPRLLLEKRDWIERASERVARQRDHIERSSTRPNRIELPALAEVWEIEWRVRDGVRTTTQARDGRLTIVGPVDCPTVWRDVLRRWLLERARECLVPWLEALACEAGVDVRRTSIRCQRTRWGSYSTRGTVSLNAQLLFLPPELVRYVLHHELCHATYPNHSPAFWALLERFEPEAKVLRRGLRDGWRRVPGWLVAADGAPSE